MSVDELPQKPRDPFSLPLLCNGWGPQRGRLWPIPSKSHAVCLVHMQLELSSLANRDSSDQDQSQTFKRQIYEVTFSLPFPIMEIARKSTTGFLSFAKLLLDLWWFFSAIKHEELASNVLLSVGNQCYASRIYTPRSYSIASL